MNECKLCRQGGNHRYQTRLHRDWVISELAANGMPVYGIATLFDLDRSTVYAVLRNYGISTTDLRKERRRADEFLAKSS